MGRKSTIDLLPEALKQALNALLRDPAVTQLEAAEEVNRLLKQAGEEERISKSSVNRYSMKMDKIGAKLKQSREISKMWIAELGSQPQGQVGHLLNEVVRNLAFDTAIALSEEEEPVPPKLIRELSIAIEKLERAASVNEKRTMEIKQQARAEAAEELTKELKNEGISEAVEASIKRILLGA
ncbi:MAG: hypothetical protein DRQ62_10775 [Gammaproteobacteria bacterium]|nr:MAG: hypothetical protein DRQ62_10775 [Gammaproteobacteria bacterium]